MENAKICVMFFYHVKRMVSTLFVQFYCIFVDRLLFLCQGESGLMGGNGPAGLKGVEVCSILILLEFIILYDLILLRMIDSYIPV